VDDREAILGRLSEGERIALPESWPVPDVRLGRDELWAAFSEKLPALGARMVAREELHAELPKGAKCTIDDDAAPFVAELKLAPARDIWEAKVGFTLAEIAIAHSGSLLVASAPGRRRLASLAPEIHIVLVPEDRIVWSLEEALKTIPERSCALITGSSRTADIESVLVRGVHGPKEVWVVRIPSGPAGANPQGPIS